MCGIYGLATSPTTYTKRQFKTVKKVLREIAVDSETRGAHSSGIAQVGNKTKIHKSLLPSSKFVDSKGYIEAVKSLKDGNYILLGHTRFATEGAIVKNNAHPFRVGDTIGAHNGCVYNIEEMQTKLDKQCPVDSQLIFKAIDDNDNIDEAVKHFDSDFALSFVKTNPMVLHLCREDNRPLYVAYVPSLLTLFYASEATFIENALIECNLDAEIYSLNKNTLYSYDVSKFSDLQTNVEKSDFEYESREYNFSINSYNTNDEYDDWTGYNYGYGNYRPLYDTSHLYDTNGKLIGSELEAEKQELLSCYGGSPNNWFFDEMEGMWSYLDEYTGQVWTETQLINGNFQQEIDFEEETDNAQPIRN